MFLKVVIVLGVVWGVHGFPDGAPIDACVKPRTNQPNHGRARPQPPESNPYALVANADAFTAGGQVVVSIVSPVEETFKGFFIQARSADTNEWIGSFEQVPNTKVYEECSAITHADPKDKKQATFIWRAPHDIPQGRVYFTGTVLKEYSTFWSDMVSQVNYQ